MITQREYDQKRREIKQLRKKIKHEERKVNQYAKEIISGISKLEKDMQNGFPKKESSPERKLKPIPFKWMPQNAVSL